MIKKKKLRPRYPRTVLRITIYEIADLFGVEPSTIRRWGRQKRLDYHDLEDIIHKYNNRHLLDKRRKTDEQDVPK